MQQPMLTKDHKSASVSLAVSFAFARSLSLSLSLRLYWLSSFYAKKDKDILSSLGFCPSEHEPSDVQNMSRDSRLTC